ncbi:MAG TPA: SGNH/GDSL hydrolase family protein [Planctomycetota bacterium]|nr:SGNH/GDSL hydrolase family protein [Planctomycetota bacterium]
MKPFHACPVLAGLALLLAGCAAPHAAAPAPLDEPLHVLLLGDSISIGYTPFVQELLAGRATVVRPMQADGVRAENCAGTNHGVEHVQRWLALDGGHWDVIHFNFGLHDLKHVHAGTGANSDDPADPHQADPERYECQLRVLLAALQQTGARLVFATTTPVPQARVRPFRAPADVVTYNDIARRVMAEAGVPVDDLYAFALPRLAQIGQRANVHFTAAGSRALAREVAASVLQVAGRPGLGG